MFAGDLNHAQRRAVESDGPVLCCACPGSGKTRVLIAKVRHVLRTHPDPWIVMTTFSRDAADEMQERIRAEKDLAQRLDRLTIGTFHALAVRQLKVAGTLGKILSEVETRHIIQRALADTGLEVSPEDAEAGIAHCKSDRAFAETHPELATLTVRYRVLQEAVGGMDFTDLMLMANDHMKAGRIPPLRATHLFADEYQDIDALQYQWLMNHLAQSPAPVPCAVGDDDQSIYGFRRSLGYRGMMDFVAATGAEIITLDTNYRSQGGIVESAGKLIAYNTDRIAKHVNVARGPGPVPQVIRLSANDIQSMRLIHLLDQVCAKNRVPEALPNRDPLRFGVKPRQVAVLSRTNAGLHAIETAMIKYRVPYVRAGRSFWDADTLQVYLAMLQALSQKEGMGLEIGLRWAGLADAAVQDLAEAAGGSLWRVIDPEDPVPWQPSGCVELDSMVRLGRGWAEKLREGTDSAVRGPIYGVAAWMSRVMTRTCGESDDGHPLQEKGMRQIRDLDRLEAARDLLASARGTLSTRIRRVQGGDSTDIPRVVLATFHASKGLEWDHVYLIDCYGGAVPRLSDSGSEEELAEERRVFYVAMTRARNELTLFTRSDKPVSEFLIDAELLGPSSTADAIPLPR